MDATATRQATEQGIIPDGILEILEGTEQALPGPESVIVGGDVFADELAGTLGYAYFQNPEGFVTALATLVNGGLNNAGDSKPTANAAALGAMIETMAGAVADGDLADLALTMGKWREAHTLPEAIEN